MKENKTQKPKISYQECDRLVKAYRDTNDPDAAQALLDAFEGYTVKFFNLIRWGKVSIHDRDVRDFIRLYMKNEFARKHIHQFKRMPAVQQEIYNVADSIKQLMAPYDNDELKNEIYMAFLTMANRYKSPDGKPRFHHYILQAFHYQLRRQLQTLVADPIVYRMAHNINFHEDFGDGEEVGFDMDMLQDESKSFTIDETLDTVNDNWVLGFTVGDEYRNLTVMERKIIKMYYLDDMSDQEIADSLGTCRATVNRRRNKAKEHLEEVFNKSKKIR